MEFRVADFEKLSFHFKKYQDGLSEIDSVKQKYLDKIEPFRKEMQSIISSSQDGSVLDQKSEKERYERFQNIQEEALSIDKDAKFEISNMKDKLNKNVYSELEEIISHWANENNIDIVIGKLEVVYMNTKYEITNIILDLLKSKNLYVNEEKVVENEKESV
jgi:Skp family chaperone for outer membrane proteins